MIDDINYIWPVNALAFHPTYNTFASGSLDATIPIWDHWVKKRLHQYPHYNVTIVPSPCSCSQRTVHASWLAQVICGMRVQREHRQLTGCCCSFVSLERRLRCITITTDNTDNMMA